MSDSTRSSQSTTTPALAGGTILASIAAIAGSTVVLAHHGQSSWNEASTWWGFLTGVLTVGALLGLGIFIGRRIRARMDARTDA